MDPRAPGPPPEVRWLGWVPGGSNHLLSMWLEPWDGHRFQDALGQRCLRCLRLKYPKTHVDPETLGFANLACHVWEFCKLIQWPHVDVAFFS